MNIVKTYVNKEKNQRIEVATEEMSENPRCWDETTKMVTSHKQYLFPWEINTPNSEFDSWDEIVSHIMENYDVECLLPVSMTDHSGLSFYTGVARGWDCGQIGFIFITKENFKKYKNKSAKEILIDRIKEYNAWSNNDVYIFNLIQLETCKCCGHTSEESIDSCGGYYGYNDIETNLKDFTDMTGFVEE